MLHSVTSVVVLVAGFLVYRSFSGTRLFKTYEKGKNNETDIYIQRLLTAFIYGGIPVLVVLFSDADAGTYGMTFPNAPLAIVTGLTTGILLIGINLLNYRKPDNLAVFPQIRKKEWDMKTLVYSAATWFIYLLGYEILFRGYMLFAMADFMGSWPAIAINVFLYSLVHFHKGVKEAAGAVPLGLVLCLLCLKTGSFLPAFIAHVFLALSNEWLSLKAHPEIHLKKK